jgi:hypothetical protein
LVPLRGGSPVTPFSFDISMGVRKGDKALKAELEEVLDKDAAAIRKILEEYGVPLVAADAVVDGNPGQEAPRERGEGTEGVHRH